MMNQIPTRTARAVTDATGNAATTIPAIRLMIPKKIHQPRPSPEAGGEASDQRGRPWMIQLRPTIRPTAPR